MKALIQKLPIEDNSSFVARTYRTPYFETPWHQHEEYELAIITEGFGTFFIGDYIGEYQSGDVFFLGRNLPHWFRKKDMDMVGSSIVIHFREDFWGEKFLNLPEIQKIKQLLLLSSKGLYLKGKLKENIAERLKLIEGLEGFNQFSELLTCLHEMSISDQYSFTNQADVVSYTLQDQELINQVFEYSMQHFKRKILLSEVASLTHKSTSAFSHYFKKSTKKNYIDFLTEIRIAHACKLLSTTQLSITQICFESGFQNWANFSKHFKTYCQISPKAYRNRWKKEADG